MKKLRNMLLVLSVVVLTVNTATATVGDDQNFETIWPGSICVPDPYTQNVDYFDDGLVENEATSTTAFHCGLTSRMSQFSYVTANGNDIDITQYEIESPVDEVKIRVYDGSNGPGTSQISCDLERRYWTRSTGATGFDEVDNDVTGTTSVGYDVLNMFLSNGTWSSSTIYYYHSAAHSLRSTQGARRRFSRCLRSGTERKL